MNQHGLVSMKGNSSCSNIVLIKFRLLSATITRLVNPAIKITEAFVEDMFKKHRIYSAAQGEEDSTLKFYLYTKHVIII